jgi:hypothetical protein
MLSALTPERFSRSLLQVFHPRLDFLLGEFRYRLFTALNLLPSMATIASDNSCISGTVQQSVRRPYRWQRHYPYQSRQ